MQLTATVEGVPDRAPTTRGGHVVETQRLEVRLLGGLHVVRGDGRPVSDAAWRTAKSADLLRLLALSAPAPVPTGSILDRFWPGVTGPAARASLRTALLHLRRAVGGRHLVRTTSGVLLADAWVDVVAYRALVAQARASVRQGWHVELVRLGRESEALYAGDFEAADDEAPWVRGERATLATLRKNLLSDAAESAVELRWLRDAIDFAEAAIAVDPGLERAHRALMRAYAGLGETDRALRVYEQCRRHLASGLGADPSPLTSAVHVQVLSGRAAVAPGVRLVGRDREVAELSAHLVEALAASTPTLVRVIGAPGSGRDAVVERALRDVGPVARSRVVVCGSDEGQRGAREHALAALGSVVRRPVPAVVVVTEAPSTPSEVWSPVVDGGLAVREITVVPVPVAALRTLAEAVLQGPVSEGLVQQLAEVCDGLPGRAVRSLLRWSARGAVVWTSEGLELVSADAGWEEQHGFGHVLRQLQRQLDPTQFELMQMIAVAQRPVAAPELARSHAGADADPSGAAVEPLLDELDDLGILRSGVQGYEFRDARLRDTTATWTRPSVRRQLHGRLASPLLPQQVRPDREPPA